eukprot:GHVQ01019458.1.p1 GENE.GHVQ01019458.1~~GHVQ01019458.1.p1  ORF type:complete len:106 (-),score=13.93 GHVQ01019458.1:341-658(-)
MSSSSSCCCYWTGWKVRCLLSRCTCLVDVFATNSLHAARGGGRHRAVVVCLRISVCCYCLCLHISVCCYCYYPIMCLTLISVIIKDDNLSSYVISQAFLVDWCDE